MYIDNDIRYTHSANKYIIDFVRKEGILGRIKNMMDETGLPFEVIRQIEDGRLDHLYYYDKDRILFYMKKFGRN